ncbi:Fc.00g094020.m01.CDS01 [Cosmosporella sp. VM-42]
MGSYGGRGPTVNAILWVETVIATAFVVLRIYTRKVILRSLGLDDLFLLITLILLAIYAALISAGTTYGIGQKRADIPPEDYIQAMKYEVIGQGVCIFNIATSKAAVAFFILRIVRETKHRIFIWICVITNSLLASWCTISIFIQCVPVAKVWDNTVPGSCWLDFAKVGITTSAYAVAIDFILAIAPCFILWDLNMKRKDKTLALFGLSLGIFAGVCGILRTTALTSLRSYNEYIHDTSDMLIYSGTENFVSAICASIPVLRPLWIKIRGYGSTGDSYPQRSYQMSRFGSQDPESALGDRDRDGMATRIFAGGRDFNTATADNASEEAILRETKGQSDSGIRVFMKTDISVNATSRGGKDSKTYS